MAGNHKVLVVFHGGELGGAAQAILRIVPLLEDRGWELAFWVPRPSPLFNRLVSDGHQVAGEPRYVEYTWRALRLPPGPLQRARRLPGYFRRFARFMRTVEPAIVHANTHYTLAEALMARVAGYRTVVYLHGMLPPGLSGEATRRLISVARLRPAAVSRASAPVLPGRDVPVIHNGVPLPSARPMPPASAVLRVGTVGRIAKHKGTDTFVEAARLVRRKDPKIEFTIIGAREEPFDQPWVDRVLLEAAEIGVNHIVEADIVRELRGWDVFAAPSREEGFGLAALEAMANGLPVIAASTGGLPEVVSPDTGVLFEPGDAAQLAGAILRLAAQPETRARMGAAGRARAAELFTLEDQAQGVHELYMSVLMPDARPLQ